MAAARLANVLAEHRPSVVTRSVLRETDTQAHLCGDTAFTFGLLYGQEQQRATTGVGFVSTAFVSHRRRR
jgi:hypothetical protein